MRKGFHDSFTLVFNVGYLIMMGNAMLIIACLPAVVVALFTDVVRTWPILAIFSVLIAPALGALFTVFRDYSEEGSIAVVRGFARAWKATARRALPIGAIAGGLLAVFLADIWVLGDTAYGVLVVPLLAVLAILVIAIFPLAIVALSEVPQARIRDLLKVATLLAVRRWYLSVISIIVVVTLIAFIVAKPALALGLAATPLLYAVWANGRYTLKPAIVEAEAPSPALSTP